MAARFPDLHFIADGPGSWRGRLPVWPFNRDKPAGLDVLTSRKGLTVEVRYREAYPVVPPSVVPTDPSPEFFRRADHRWHLNGDGSLCLLRSEALWTPRESLVGLLLKAAGWRVEYELMEAGLITAMSENGIVSDPV
ncbi:MAG: hypothetical protein M3467_00670, partial [Actinomycetota bacterium]|nr:hypothetical protein [Actinomycetota bacterium]